MTDSTAELGRAIEVEAHDSGSIEANDVVMSWVVVAAIESPERPHTEYVTLYPNRRLPLHEGIGLLRCGLETLDTIEPA